MSDDRPVPAIPEPPSSPVPGGSVPPRATTSRPRDHERPTRKPMSFWDRSKILVLFLGAFVILLWSSLAQFDPQITFSEALAQTVRQSWWLLVLIGLEAIRQLHYVISEHSERYHRFWTRRIF